MWVQVELDGTLSSNPIGSIIAFGNVTIPQSGINVFTEGVPLDYDISRYSYNPSDPSVYDPNGFALIEPSPVDPEQP